MPIITTKYSHPACIKVGDIVYSYLARVLRAETLPQKVQCHRLHMIVTRCDLE